MENRVEVRTSGNQLEIHVSGKLTKEMYEEFVPLVEEAIREHGKLHMLFVMNNFSGWTAGALWDDLKFDLAHFRDVARLAIVGDRKWQRGMAVFCRPFTTAKIKYFHHADLEAARAWLEEPATRTASTGF
jgi:hypothetical protein